MIFTILIQILGLTPVLSMTAVTKDLLTPIIEYGEACGYASCPVMGRNVLNVHIVPSMHAELGFSRSFYEHYNGYQEGYEQSTANMKHILDAVLTSLWTDKRRKFTFSDMPYLFHWWKSRDMTVKRMIYELLRQGRLYFVGGGWSMSDEATTNYHAIIDQFTYSLRKINATFLECGRPLVTWQVETFGHSREFASLMAQMGFDGHFINPISFEDELTRLRSKSLEFVWRGSDDLGSDSDIYTHKLFDGYWPPPGFCFGSRCEDPLIVTTDATAKNLEEKIEEFMGLMYKRQSPYYTTKHVMVIMGQRMGYYDANMWFSNIDKLMYNLNAKQKTRKDKAYLFYSTPACYLKAVQAESPKLTTKQDDFYPHSINKDTQASGLFTSRPLLKYLARELHLFLQIAKQLQVFGDLDNNDKKFEDIMWTHGVIQDHGIITGGSIPVVTEFYMNKINQAKNLCLTILKDGFNYLRYSPNKMTYYACQFNMSSCWNIQANRFFTVIYNPLAWPVTMPVRLPVSRGIYKVFDPKGVQQNHSIVKLPELVAFIPGRGEFFTEDELVFLAENLPPMGYRSYYVEQVQVRTRTRRSIIKKLNKKSKKKKFLIRQTNNLKIDDKSLLDDIPDYEYFEETTDKSSTREVFNQSALRELEQYNDEVVTSPSRTIVSETTEASTTAFPNVTKTTSPLTLTRSTSKILPSLTRTTQKFNITTKKPLDLDIYYDDDTTTPPPPATTTDSFEVDKFYRRMEKSGYHSSESKNKFIKNEYIRINLDSARKLSNIVLSNGVNITFNVQMYYYVSDDPQRLGTLKKKPGAFIFRPIDPYPVNIGSNYEVLVVKSEIVEEMQIFYSDYAGVTLKLYKSLPVIEVDWIVGPIPFTDNLGKEVFVRYTTNIVNKGVFYTDSNGRQTIKRIRDVRPTYKPVVDNPVSGIAANTYPVTSKIYIEDLDKNIRLSVFPDRSQGGASIYDGTIDMMLHRRIFTDDNNIRAWLNDSNPIIRGKHHLYISKADYRPNKVFEKKFAKELELGPSVFTSIHNSYYNITYDDWFSMKNEFSGIKKKLPFGVHVLTLEKWHDKLLLRLENYLEKSDVIKSGFKRVQIKDLFTAFKIVSIEEMTLGANMLLKDHVPLHWKKDKFVTSFNDVYGNETVKFSDDQGDFTKPLPVASLNDGIELYPQQIRTFVVGFTRKYFD